VGIRLEKAIVNLGVKNGDYVKIQIKIREKV
jgi:hypothetical protein